MRKNIVYALFGFSVGVIAGIVKDKLDSIETVDVKTGSDILNEEAPEKSESTDDASEPAMTSVDYSKYKTMTEQYKEKSKKETVVRNQPIVISPEDYGEEEYYDQIEFIYLNDDILMNENYEVVENRERFIGDALNHFGEYEEDSVYVRNDSLKAYFAILKDERKSTDIPKMYAH